MLLGNQIQNTSAAVVDDSFISELILQNRYGEAYQLLSGLKEDKVWVLHDLALVLIRAGNYPLALAKLDAMQTLLPAVRPQLNVNETAKALSDREVIQENHMLPVTERYIAMFPHLVRENLLRLKIDCYAATGQWNEVIRTAAQLGPRKFRNVEDALAKANNRKYSGQ